MAEFVRAGRTVPAGNGWAWIGQAWLLFTKAPLAWIVIALILGVITGLTAIPILGWILGIALMVLTPTLVAGLMIGCRAIEDGRALEVGHLFAGLRDRFWTLLGIGVTYLVATTLI